MSIHTHFWIQQRTQRLEQSCHSAVSAISRAKTMREVATAARISVPPELRAVRHTVPGFRALKQAAERQMETLLKSHLEAMSAAPTAEECKALRGKYMLNDWQFLRGDYARVLQYADRESLRIMHKHATSI